jgi:replicative DNA helicase
MSDAYNDADYLELTIKCLFRDKATLQKAVELGVKPEDFGSIEIYRAFVATALGIATAPIDPQLCLIKLKVELQERGIIHLEEALTLWEFVYSGELQNADYIAKHLAEFVKFRRYQTLKVDKLSSPEALVSEAGRLVSDIELKDSAGAIREFDPFENLVLVEHKESLMTGFPAIDAVARGLNYQEFGIILGHSGSGKTAMGVYSAVQNAKMYRNVLYLSLEEPAENICSRVYSNIFRISYSDLHKGSTFAQQDLKAAWANMSDRDRQALKHLKIHDMREATPCTAKYIQNYLDDLYERTGYHPDLVYIDQMDYLTTSDKSESEWQKYGKVAFDVDDLSNHLIGGKHMFSVWLLHQATGKMTRKFTNGEISGFKGIIKPADMCLAIGRDSSQDSVVSIFSLKSRHAKNFQFDFLAELEFMNFEHQDKAAEARMEEEDKDKKKTKKSNFSNIPGKAELLPSASSGFKATA